MGVKSALRAAALLIVAASADEHLGYLQSNRNVPVNILPDNANPSSMGLPTSDYLGPNGEPLPNLIPALPGQEMSSYQVQWSGKRAQSFGNDAPDYMNPDLDQQKPRRRRNNGKLFNQSGWNSPSNGGGDDVVVNPYQSGSQPGSVDILIIGGDNSAGKPDYTGGNPAPDAPIYRDQFGNSIPTSTRDVKGTMFRSRASPNSNAGPGPNGSPSDSECSGGNGQAQIPAVDYPVDGDKYNEMPRQDGVTTRSGNSNLFMPKTTTNGQPQAAVDVAMRRDANGNIIPGPVPDNAVRDSQGNMIVPKSMPPPKFAVDVAMARDTNGNIIPGPIPDNAVRDSFGNFIVPRAVPNN